ncbi:hypothetical protein SNOG_12398 [Parastagonospora nodorum SN15]|uniref:Uncharacterized protein n=1 Tax=Phaeosphaeria nodorum (strain SN15 / ATCC MYA-4574 / FGSC 10173) TaxID=321614 RepID=Q0U766_PHANO|nr:hypothetical protein SNOG_12398 [Parastagonospora nodorum SN15]EAT80211.1 hypothetical protein SNOG_12398 [Parastagonospora nodorum SN15]
MSLLPDDTPRHPTCRRLREYSGSIRQQPEIITLNTELATSPTKTAIRHRLGRRQTSLAGHPAARSTRDPSQRPEKPSYRRTCEKKAHRAARE